MIFALALSVLVLVCVLLVSLFGKKWDLNPFVALSAGGLLSLTFLHFLPHSFSKNVSFVGGFVLIGILVQIIFELYIVKYFHFLDHFLESHSVPESHNHSHVISPATTCSVVGCLIICSFFDGIRFFAGLSITSSIGFLTGVIVFFHLLSEGVMVAFMGLKSRLKKKVIFLLSACLCGSFLLGSFLAQGASYWFEKTYMQAFATGILIYVCFFHLLPLALKKQYRVWFVLGLILFSVPHFLHPH